MFLGIEIGGTKLQVGLGAGDGILRRLWRGKVNPADGGDGIRRQLQNVVPQLLKDSGTTSQELRGVGVGFGGPTNDTTMSVIKSHHIAGWDNFPLAAWLGEILQVPVVICNDADVAGLGEAMHGAGQGLSPIFYITVGTGIGGGLILNGEIYRGIGHGAAEVGHVRPVFPRDSPLAGEILEAFASGTGIGVNGSEALGQTYTGAQVAELAKQGNLHALKTLDIATQALAEGICTVIKLLCPRRIIIGGGVSLLGEELFFAPIRKYVAERGFQAFAGLTDIVPAALGEEVVIHGALALAKKRWG